MDKEIFTLENLPQKYNGEWLGFILLYNNYKFNAAYSGLMFCVWDNFGIESVCEYDIRDISTEKTKFEIKTILNNFIDGFAICSCCRKPIRRNDIGLTLCAGIYCKDCVTPELRKESDWFYSHLD
jgi:hypothetical protein